MVNTFLGALTVLALTKGLSAAAIINPADAYFTVTCQTGSILDTGASPSGRWADAKADLAFEAAARNWNEVPGSQGSSVSLNFVNSMLRLWGQGDTVNCGLVEGSCDYSALQCGDDTAKGDTPFPGAWEILKSLSHLHAYYLNIYNSFGAAGSALSSTMSSFVDTFAPEQEESLIEKIIDGAEEAAMNLIMSEVLGPLLDKIGEEFSEDVWDAIKDQVIDSATSAVQYGVSSGDLPDETQDQKASTLVNTLQNIIGTHQATLSAYITNLLSGSATTLSSLHENFANGNWLIDQLGSQDQYALSSIATSAFAALLVPQAWQLNKLQPIILMENKDCDPGNPLSLMNNAATHSGGTCGVGSSQTFFLVGFSNFQCTYGSYGNYGGGNYACTTDVFQPLPGIDQLSNYGFVKDDIVKSVYAQYQLNGNKNGSPLQTNQTATDGSGNTGAFPFSAGVDTPGLFPGIPICDINVAAKTWGNSANAIQSAADLCP